MLINHLDVRTLIGFVFLNKQSGMLAQVSTCNKNTPLWRKSDFLRVGEQEGGSREGWKPRKEAHVPYQSEGLVV